MTISYRFLIVCIAALVASVEIIPVILASVLNINYGNTSIGMLHQHLNNTMKLSYISWLTFDILIIYFISLIFTKTSWNISLKLLATFGLLLFAYLMVYPFLVIINIILELILDNGPFISNHLKYKYFPGARQIELACKEIQKEFKANTVQKECIHETVPGFIISTPNKNNCWRTLILKHQGKVASIVANMPSLKRVLSDPIIHNALFSILDGNVNIPPHVGYYKGYLRYHIGIDIPSENGISPFIVCGGHKYNWKNCEGVIFDDMFLHYVGNPTSKQRVVLYLDIERRDIPMILQPIYQLSNWYINTHIVLKKLVKIQHASISKK